MSDVYPEFADSVAFYIVGSDPSESLEDLEKDRFTNNYPGYVATPSGDMIRKLNVLNRSTKLAIDAHGVIIYRATYGDGDTNEWRQVFRNLVASTTNSSKTIPGTIYEPIPKNFALR